MMKAAIILFFLILRVSGDEKKWVNPFDMTGESLEPPVVPEKQHPQTQTPPKRQETNLVNQCAKEKKGIDYGTFYRQLVKRLWSKVRDARLRLSSDRLLAFVDVSPRAQHVLDAFVDADEESKVPEVNEALETIFRAYDVAGEKPTSDWSIYIVQVREVVTWIILGLALFVVCLPIVFIARSPFSGVFKFALAVFYFSWVWTWIVLYKKEVANRRAAHVVQASACRPEPWFVEIGHYFASYLVVVPDHCAALHERLEVDPWLEINPVRALVHMLTQVVLEPSRPLAEHMVRFVRTVSAGLPVPHAVAALLGTVAILVLLLIFIFGYRIRIPLLLSVEPAERQASVSLTPESEARLQKLIRMAIEEKHEKRSLVARRSSQKAERILTHRPLVKEAGDCCVLDEESESTDQEPPETLQ